MLYEVTGMRLQLDEFQGEDSSDSCGDDEGEELQPSDFAFMERFYEDNDEGSATQVLHSLNP